MEGSHAKIILILRSDFTREVGALEDFTDIPDIPAFGGIVDGLHGTIIIVEWSGGAREEGEETGRRPSVP